MIYQSVLDLDKQIADLQLLRNAEIRRVQLICPHAHVLHVNDWQGNRNIKVCNDCGLAEEDYFSQWFVLTTEYVKRVSRAEIAKAMHGYLITHRHHPLLRDGKVTLAQVLAGEVHVEPR